MNRFAIFLLVALSCISFAPTQADPEEVCKLKKAYIYGGPDCGVYDKEDLYLYKDVKAGKINYAIRNNSRQLGDDFSISLHDTVVFEDEIVIGYVHGTIILVFNENSFSFYEDLFPHALGDYSLSFPAKKASRGGKTWRDISVIRTKQLENGEWLVVALDGIKPRLIFPVNFVELSLVVSYKLTISVHLKTKVDIIIYLEFGESFALSEFESFLDPEFH